MTARRKLPVHELTDAGISVAQNYITALQDGLRIPFPDRLLTDPQYATPVKPRVHVEQRSFETRCDAGLYLFHSLDSIDPTRVIGNARLWSWLGIFYLESMVKKDTDGTPILGSNPPRKYIVAPQGKVGRTNHHRLMLAYETYLRHKESAWFMLGEPVDSLSTFTARLSGKTEAFRSVGVVDLAHRLYADRRTRKLKSRSLGYDRATAPPGSLPRLLDVLDQLYMTYDVYGMTADRILPLLPPEFDRFKPVAVD